MQQHNDSGRWRESCQSVTGTNKEPFLSIPAPPSFETVWNDHLKSRLTDATIQNLWDIHQELARETPNKTVDEAYNEMKRDVSRQLRSFRLDLLKRSLTQPIRFRQSQELLDVLYRRLQSETKSENSKHPPPPPLRILATGGSPTAGVNANLQYWTITRDTRGDNLVEGSWPNMLGKLLNRALPLEQKLSVSSSKITDQRVWVEVDNIATGGVRSDAGALMLRHKMWRPDWGPIGPDIVFCAHGTNDYIQDGDGGDGRDADLIKTTTQVYMEDLLQTANAVRPCYNESSLPVALLLDEYVGSWGVDDVLEYPYTITAFHRLVAQLSGWYQTGAVNYANAVRHLITEQPTLNEHGHNPFTGRPGQASLRHGARNHACAHGLLSAVESMAIVHGRAIHWEKQAKPWQSRQHW